MSTTALYPVFPWKAERHDCGIEIWAPGSHVADVTYQGTPEATWATAVLLANAPRLLAAAKDAEAVLQSVMQEEHFDVWLRLQSAIIAATDARE